MRRRDYDQEVTLTLSLGTWNIIYALMAEAQRNRANNDDWPEEEIEREYDARKAFVTELGEQSPGNGMDDWPDSMKEAYNDTIDKMLQDYDDTQ